MPPRPTASPCATRSGAEWRGHHLPRAGPARRRGRLLADRRRRRAAATGSSSTGPTRRGGRLPTWPSWRPAPSRSRSTPRTPRIRPSTSSATPAPRWRSSAAPNSTSTSRRCTARPARSPGSSRSTRPSRSTLADSCPLSVPLAHPVSPRARRTRRCRAPRRRRDDHLHVGHDRRPEGRRPDATRTSSSSSRRSTGSSRVTERDRSLCFLPLSHAYERAWTFYVLSQGRAELLPRRSEARPRSHAGGAADVHGQRAAPLREDLLDGAPQGEPGVGGRSRSCSQWAVKVGNRYAHAKKRGGARGPGARGAARPGGQAGAPQDPRHRGRPEELLLGRRRRAVRGDRGVLLRGGAAGLPGLRPDRNLADADVQQPEALHASAPSAG